MTTNQNNPYGHVATPSGAYSRDDTRVDAVGAPDTDQSRFTDTRDLDERSDPSGSQTRHSSPSERVFAGATPYTRQDTLDRQQTRMPASVHDETRIDAPLRDETPVGANATDSAANAEEVEPPKTRWVTIEQAADHLRQKGVTRAIRTIQKMCQRGTLTCELVPTEIGSRYLIVEESIDAFVEQQNAKLPSGTFFIRNGSDQTDDKVAAGDNAPFNQTMASEASADRWEPQPATQPQTGVDQLAHAQEIIQLKDEQLAMQRAQIETANKQLAVKDEQILSMMDRDHETNVLLQNLQRMAGLLSANPDVDPMNPYSASVRNDHQPPLEMN
ncbi:MAG: helix-turn-helix domain-containing protein [Pseudomonadota bacterium]